MKYLKIPQSVRGHFEVLEADYNELKPVVDELIRGCIPERWLYFSRVKSIESFYVKMQQGRRGSLYEDILAGTIVVERAVQIDKAVEYLKESFEVESRRPVNPAETNKAPESFQFDDLRLYLRLKERQRYGDFSKYKFEIQIKTYLQHAWIIATHDLVYKSDKADSWAKKRVAYQIKAMLEHVETSIATVEELAKSKIVNLSTLQINERIKIAEQIKLWDYDLGQSTGKIVENIQNIIHMCEVSWIDVVGWVNNETQSNSAGGCNATRFSLFEIILDAICCHNCDAIKRGLKKIAKKNSCKIPVASEFLELHPECEPYLEAIGAVNS
jgi:ppGpp synthetase/RelA/SpoT-type nucleotidyltranferase